MDIGHWIMLALIVFLVLCPPRYDPAIRWKERNEKPSCFGTYPFLNGQEMAERDCQHCSHANACHEDSPHPRRTR